MVDDEFLHSLRPVGGFGDFRNGLAGLDVVDCNFVLSLVVSVSLLKKTGKCRV